MNSFQAAALACRLLALYFLFQALATTSQVPLALLMLSQADAHRVLGSSSEPVLQLILLSYFLPFLPAMAFAAFLWIKANWLAKRMTAPDAPFEGAAAVPDYACLQRVLLTLIGIFLLVTVMPEAVRALVTALLTPDTAVKSAADVAKVVAENWSLLIRFAFGFTFLFAAPAISYKLDKLHASR